MHRRRLGGRSGERAERFGLGSTYAGRRARGVRVDRQGLVGSVAAGRGRSLNWLLVCFVLNCFDYAHVNELESANLLVQNAGPNAGLVHINDIDLLADLHKGNR